MIRVVLPFHLRNLARVDSEVELEVASPVTVRAVLDALEARYPVLRGTMRDHGTMKRRPFVRFFACKEDLSLESPETQLPDEVVSGVEPFLIVGAMAGGETPREMPMDLYVGTSGYSYKEWKGTFYPEDMPDKQMLRFYGERFRSVEINNTFYRMPKASVLEAWAAEVPADFKFVLKASQRITHLQRLK